MSKSRYPKLRKGANGEKLCRGCGNPVPKGRQTWCSTECWHNNDPNMSRRIVIKRDGWICRLCGVDIKKAKSDWKASEPPIYVEVPGQRPGLSKEWNPAHSEWWDKRPRREVDHIVPFSKGGSHHPDNLRVLCHECHKSVTRAFAKERAASKKPVKQAELALLLVLMMILSCACSSSNPALQPSNPFPTEAWVLEHSTNDPVASPELPWSAFSLHAITTTNCLPLGTTNDGPYLKIPHLGQLWYFVVFTNKGPDSGWVEFTTRYVTQP